MKNTQEIGHSVPILEELRSLVRGVRRVFCPVVPVPEESIAVDKKTGYIYYSGEMVPPEVEAQVFQKGMFAGRAIIFGQKCPNPCNIWRIYFRAERPYSLADEIFEEIPVSGTEYVDFDVFERRYLDLDAIRNQAEIELSAVSSGRVGDDGWYFGRCSGVKALYKWCGETVLTERRLTVMERYDNIRP